MSHEIRTPLGGIIGILSLFKDTPLNEEQKMFVDIMGKSSDTLLSLINDILDFSKIGSGMLVLDQKKFDIYALVNETISILEGKLKEGNLKLYCKFEPTVEKYFVGDQTRIRQILLNLIGNAIKFTKEGRIDVLIEKKSQSNENTILKISVSDTGVGINPDALDKIFEPFTQADGGISREFGGTGLGLSIVEKLVNAMGGDIYVDSVVDKGSTFVFTLLLKSAQLVMEDSANGAELQKSNTEMKFNSSEQLAKVLLVEDNPVNCIVTCSMLIKMNYHVDYASDGEEAMRMIKTEKYNIVLMDCHLPGMDGFRTTEEIRKWERGAGINPIPIIAITADIMEGIYQRCINAGMNDYLSKPIVFKILKETLGKYLSSDLAGHTDKHKVYQ